MCNFCKLLSQVKDSQDYYKKADYTTTYVAALQTNTFYQDEITSCCTYGNYQLNYCPECGKKIKK